MIVENGQKRRLTAGELIFYLLFSIVLNSFSNGLAVASNLGSAVWTASAVNLNNLLAGNLGTVLFVYAIAVQIVNILIRRKIEWRMLGGNLFFAFSFSYLVQFWTHLFVLSGLPQYQFGWRLGIDLLAVCGIAVATSIYQRVNVLLHPNDEFSYLIRYRFVHGSAAWGQYLSYSIPVAIMIYCYVCKHQLLAVNIGTFFALFFQGPIIGWADLHVFKRLHHRLSLKVSKIE